MGGAAAASSNGASAVAGGQTANAQNPGQASSSGVSLPGSAPAGGSQSATGSWWSDNLLVLITGILAILALIVAWVMRRARGEPRDEYDDTPYDDDAGGSAPNGGDPAMREQFNRRLESIDLNLESPPDDNGYPPRR